MWDSDENVYYKISKQPTTKTMYMYGGWSHGIWLGHQPSHMDFTRWKMQ
jgi:hypothetical protein